MSPSKSNAFSQKARRAEDPPISWLMRMALQRPQLISLAAGFTDSSSLPSREVSEIFGELAADSRALQRALQYGSAQGDEGLRRWTADRLAAADGLRDPGASAHPDRVVIGNGSQQLLALATDALCDAGDLVLIEDPTYFVYLGILQNLGIEGVPFRDVAEFRSRLAELKRDGQLSRLKLAYLVSYFRNPTGDTATFEEKKEMLAELAKAERDAGHPIYFLEDAAYRDLRFEGGDTQSAVAADPKLERVIYTATYTKPFATGLKVGFGLFPDEILPVILRFKGNEDFGTSHFDQQIVARAASSGRYEKHLEELREVYRRKADAMRKGLERHFPSSAKWNAPLGGLYFWVSLPESADCGVKSEIFQAAIAADVLYVPGELCYAPSPRRRVPTHQMRLSFGSAPIDQIEEGLRRLGAVLRDQLAPAASSTAR
ncbi:MAG: PLP-dependent aminotransferase family protein [Verrucomicrobiae bacterium]|nr:PLP-dependent aminotransferase family protein [Verrucomicrobiae bacterium]